MGVNTTVWSSASNVDDGGTIEFLMRPDVLREPKIQSYISSELEELAERGDSITTSFSEQARYAFDRILSHPYYYLRTKLNPLWYLRELALRLFLMSEYNSLEVGRYRLSRHKHLWMYDRFSLIRLLTNNNFVDVRITDPCTSYIPGWKNFELDVDEHGKEYKCGSIYVEGRKK